MIIFSFIENSKNPASLQDIRQVEINEEIGLPQILVSFYCSSNGAYIKRCTISVSGMRIVPQEICTLTQIDRRTSLSDNYILFGRCENGQLLWNTIDNSVYFYNNLNTMPIYVFNSIDDFFDVLNIAVKDSNSVYDVDKRKFVSFERKIQQNQRKTRCLNCNSEIPINIGKCPYCNIKIKKRKKFIPKVIIAIVILIIGILIISAISENSANKKAEELITKLENQKVDIIYLDGLSEKEKEEFNNAESVFAGVKETDDTILLPLGNSLITTNLYIKNINYKEISNNYGGYSIETAKGSIDISMEDYWERDFKPIDRLYISGYDIKSMKKYNWSIEREDDVEINGIVFECYRESDEWDDTYFMIGVLDEEYYLKIRYYGAPKDMSDFIKDVEVIRK